MKLQRLSAILLLSVPLLVGSTRQCPEDMVPLRGGGCIDRYEWPNRRGELPHLALSGLPVGNEHGFDAKGLCESVGKHVCTANEWVSACLAAAPPASLCNTSKPWIRPDERKIAERDADELARLDQRVPSGSMGGCVSQGGVYDLIGNVEEWVQCPGEGVQDWCLAGRFWSEYRGCTQLVKNHSPRWWYYETGTRCCL